MLQTRSKVVSYLQSQLPISYTNVHEDHVQSHFIDKWMVEKGSVMPASPGVTSYTLTYGYDPSRAEFFYDAHVNWKDIAKKLAAYLPKWQVLHRSRLITAAWSPLRVYEHGRRMNNFSKFRQRLENEIALTDTESSELFQAFLDETLAAMSFDITHIAEYVREHKDSSIGSGIKWNDLRTTTREDWILIYERIKYELEEMKKHEGQYSTLDWNTGMRSRPDPLDGISDYYSGVLNRTRIINFHPALSMQNIFFLDKPHYLRKLYDIALSMRDVTTEFIFPSVDGGSIYSDAAHFFNEQLPYQAADGKAWEVSVGTILGKSFKPMFLPTSANGVSVSMLPTGTFNTTSCNTLANIFTNANVGGWMISHSDDSCSWDARERLTYPWMERAEGDQEHKFILGVSYEQNPFQPRICGLKATSDRAERMKPITIDRTRVESRIHVSGRNSKTETATWVGLYLGYYGSGTLLDTLEGTRLEKRDYIDPSRLISEMVSSSPSKSESSQDYPWLDELGVTRGEI
jgi:hypothetical protein